MALSAGTRLGPYEILAPLGAGGMGEVYRARDPRLDRTVAIKVLPDDLAADPQLKARLEREARAISALAHPHICTLHDVGEEDGRTFLVMEHLEGDTLSERLRRGPLPLDTALEVAIQIADALTAAHRQGIVHRDLKPGNVMLTKTGARLLDFGLARLTSRAELPAIESLSSVPTEAEPLTAAGTIMGTLPYMAPEQLEGGETDPRTDLWALGAILYEMLTGRRAFEAPSAAGLVGAILEREPPPLAERQPLTPPSLERLVRRCLAKDPDERWDGAHDVAVLLREIAQASAEPETSGSRTPSRWAIPGLVAAVVGALLAGAFGARFWQGTPEGPVIRSEIDLTAERPLTGQHPSRTMLALSPDGTLLAWAASPDGTPAESALYLRRLDTGEVTLIPGTEGAVQPFFSPDGRWIGFWSAANGRGKLRKVAVEGGLAVDLADGSLPMGTSWGTDGKVYLGSLNRGIQWVPADGGPPREITTVDPAREVGHRFPSVLPGGRVLLFTTMPGAFGVTARIEAVSLATGERTVVVEDGADARYLPSGHLVFVQRGVLMAAPFDLSRLELASPPIPVIEGLSQALNAGSSGGNSGAGQYAVSDSGLLVYAPGGMARNPQVELILVDETGRTEPLPGFDKTTVSAQLQFSPDGRQLVVVEQSPRGLLWLFDVERQTFRALSDRGVASAPRWSPDETRVVMGWTEGGPAHLWMVPADRGEWERLTQGDHSDAAPSWSPDGQFLAFVRSGAPSVDVFLYRFQDRQVVPFLTTSAHEGFPDFSPDGRWLAYVSSESGRDEVYVTSFPDREQTLTVSRRGGRAPSWSRDGRRLFYYSHPPGEDGRRSMMVVPVRRDPELSLGQPAALFRLPEGFSALAPMRSYELHPDGRRFLVGIEKEQEPSPRITRLHLVHNWFEELERLVPTD